MIDPQCPYRDMCTLYTKDCYGVDITRTCTIFRRLETRDLEIERQKVLEMYPITMNDMHLARVLEARRI